MTKMSARALVVMLTAELLVRRRISDSMLLKSYQKSVEMGQNTHLLNFVNTRMPENANFPVSSDPLRNRFDFIIEHRSVHVWVKTDIIVMHYRRYRDMQDVLGASVDN
jgi:hypothetical protein